MGGGGGGVGDQTGNNGRLFPVLHAGWFGQGRLAQYFHVCKTRFVQSCPINHKTSCRTIPLNSFKKSDLVFLVEGHSLA